MFENEKFLFEKAHINVFEGLVPITFMNLLQCNLYPHTDNLQDNEICLDQV